MSGANEAMQFFGPREVAAALPWDRLIESIETAMVAEGGESPDRTMHEVPVANAADAALLLKPAWIMGDLIAVKVVSVFPDNGALGLPTINAGVLLFSATNGVFLGACDGNELTTRRTAAASAVAAKRLARHDVRRLLVVGSGALSPMAAQAHAAVRDYEAIEIWGRNPTAAAGVADELVSAGYPAQASTDLDASVAAADVICGVTGSTEPLVKGALLQEGTHVDLIGSFTPTMRETDDDVIRRASVYADTRTDGILAGDLAQPMAAGLLTVDDIQGDLRELIDGTAPGRQDPTEITVYKSAGIALEDLAAAKLVFDL